MAAPRAGDIPASLRAIKPFIIIHTQLEKKEPVVSYFGMCGVCDVCDVCNVCVVCVQCSCMLSGRVSIHLTLKLRPV